MITLIFFQLQEKSESPLDFLPANQDSELLPIPYITGKDVHISSLSVLARPAHSSRISSFVSGSSCFLQYTVMLFGLKHPGRASILYEDELIKCWVMCRSVLYTIKKNQSQTKQVKL